VAGCVAGAWRHVVVVVMQKRWCMCGSDEVNEGGCFSQKHGASVRCCNAMVVHESGAYL